MIIQKTYKFKLKSTATQEKYFNDCISHCRYLYNVAKETREWAYRSYGLSYSYYDLVNELPALKKQEKWLKDVPIESLEDVLSRLDLAFQSFLKGGDYPKWAKKEVYNSITFKSVKQDTYDCITLPKIGSVKYFVSQEIKGEIHTATVAKEIGRYYIYIVANQEKEANLKPINKRQAIGIDTGITDFATISKEEYHFLKEHLNRLKIAERSLIRKVQFSNNWYKQKEVVEKLRLKIKRKRLIFKRKPPTQLVQENDHHPISSIMSKSKEASKDDTPPILKSWNQLYWLVLIVHSIIITLFYLFSKAYS